VTEFFFAFCNNLKYADEEIGIGIENLDKEALNVSFTFYCPNFRFLQVLFTLPLCSDFYFCQRIWVLLQNAKKKIFNAKIFWVWKIQFFM